MLYVYIIQKWYILVVSNLFQSVSVLLAFPPRSYCTSNPKKVPHRTPGHHLLPIPLTPWLWMRMMISAQWGHSSLDSKDSGRELVLNFFEETVPLRLGGKESGCLEKDVKIWFVEVETELNFTEISKCPNPFRHLNSSKPKKCRNLWVSSPLTSFRKVS